MVSNCPECGEYAYATRIQDQSPLICRACRYYLDQYTGEDGFDTDMEINARVWSMTDLDYEYQEPHPKAGQERDREAERRQHPKYND